MKAYGTEGLFVIFDLTPAVANISLFVFLSPQTGTIPYPFGKHHTPSILSALFKQPIHSQPAIATTLIVDNPVTQPYPSRHCIPQQHFTAPK
jgi:hypothetical protein